MKKIYKQIIGGIIGAITLGLFSGFSFMNYGGNHGCWPFVESLMRSKGYEACGGFGLLAGAAVGAVLGAILFSLNWANLFKK